MTLELIGLMAYVILQLGIGVYVSRRARSEVDYYLAGRNLGMVLATCSIAATWFGAETCLGSSGMVYGSGLSSGRTDPFGYALCLVLMAVLLATRLWKGGFVTLGDLFRGRFGPRVEVLAVLLMVPTSLLWAGAQVRAFGQILAVSSGTTWQLGALAATLVVIVYSAMGGLRADVLTDFVQGIAITIGLAVLAFATVSHLGGLGSAFSSIDPERLRLVAAGESWLSQLDGWMIPMAGSLVAQELIARVSASRTAEVARNATFAAASLYLAIGLLPIGLALMGPALVPGLEDHEQFLPRLARSYLSPVLFVLFAGAIVSAILSTVDSALLAVGSLVSHNVLRVWTGAASERSKLLAARVCVIIAGMVAYAIAVTSESIHGLVASASGFGSAGLLVITFFGLFSGYGGPRAATASLVAGVIAIVAAEQFMQLQAPFLFSGAAAVAAFVLAGVFETGRRARV
jgi:Na+/proline symporter